MKVSIIIPVYNVEMLLDRCIASVINQTYTNLEIILVDDGSPDKCGEICDAWAEKDNRIKVIHKANGGLSDARNAGLEIASGDFVAFLDSDDYFLDNFSKVCEFVNQNQDNDVVVSKHGIDKINGLVYPISACMKFFKLDFLRNNSIKFEKGIYHEDVVFSLEVVYHTDKIKTVDENFYYYDLSSVTSITREHNEAKYIKRFKDIYESVERFNKVHDGILKTKKYMKFLSRTMYDTLRLARLIREKKNQSEVIEIIKENKWRLKYPRRFSDVLIKMFMSVFGIKNTIKIMSLLK